MVAGARCVSAPMADVGRTALPRHHANLSGFLDIPLAVAANAENRQMLDLGVEVVLFAHGMPQRIQQRVRCIQYLPAFGANQVVVKPFTEQLVLGGAPPEVCFAHEV